MQKHGANLKVKTPSQGTLLHVVAEECDLEVMQMLLTEGLDPNAVNDKGHTALDVALSNHPAPYCFPPGQRDSYTQHTRTVRLLMEKGSRANSIDRYLGRTPAFTQ